MLLELAVENYLLGCRYQLKYCYSTVLKSDCRLADRLIHQAELVDQC